MLHPATKVRRRRRTWRRRRKRKRKRKRKRRRRRRTVTVTEQLKTTEPRITKEKGMMMEQPTMAEPFMIVTTMEVGVIMLKEAMTALLEVGIIMLKEAMTALLEVEIIMLKEEMTVLLWPLRLPLLAISLQRNLSWYCLVTVLYLQLLRSLLHL
jgi:hypothetical protein